MSVMAAVHNGGWPPDFTAWTPSDWSAFGTCATFAVAFVAAIYAKGQLAEARTLRKEQAQPYVAVYMQASPGHQRQIDLVVRNFGATVAKDVQVLIHPPPERSGVGGGTRETLWLPDAIPALAPNQEWRTWWDDGPTRFEEGLPERHEATVTCTDSHANRMEPIGAVLDWGAYKQAHYVTTHGIHEVATALREINRTTKGWSNGRRGLAVWGYDGEAYARAQVEAINRQEARSGVTFMRHGTEGPRPAPALQPKGKVSQMWSWVRRHSAGLR